MLMPLSSYKPAVLHCGKCFSAKFHDYGVYICSHTKEILCEKESYEVKCTGKCGRNSSRTRTYLQTRYRPVNWIKKDNCPYYWDEVMNFANSLRKAATIEELQAIGAKIKEDVFYEQHKVLLRVEYKARLTILKAV